MDILKAALNRTGMTASAYIRELIRTGGNIDTSNPEDRARAIRVIAGIANNINQAVKLGNSQGRLYYSDIEKFLPGFRLSVHLAGRKRKKRDLTKQIKTSQGQCFLQTGL